MIEPRDRVFGFVSYSCQNGECERCRPHKPAPSRSDAMAPNCVHECHEEEPAS